jgi:hypothetical protein
MGAEEWNMKERILTRRMEYFVLKEKMKENECGWSNAPLENTHAHATLN